MKKGCLPATLLFILLLTGAAVAWKLTQKDENSPSGGRSRSERRALPVEVAPLERRTLREIRRFSGSLQASAQVDIAPKLSGRVREMNFDLGDRLQPGDQVALLDDEEVLQELARATADLAVAQAREREAVSEQALAEKDLARVRSLAEQRISSPADLDQAEAEALTKAAALELAKAAVKAEEARRNAAEIRLGYTRVDASWDQAEGARQVSRRYVDPGTTLSANQPLLQVVDLDPVLARFEVAERDYARLSLDQEVSLSTDAYPGERFTGRISRISPVFNEATRQARIEVEIANPDERLKPGLFVRADVVLAVQEDSLTAPLAALTRRGNKLGLFYVEPGTVPIARWLEVQTGIEEAPRVELIGMNLQGDVVVLGQQLLDDGSPLLLQDTSGERP